MKKFFLVSCIVLSMVIVAMGVAFAGTVTQWEMVYDHDANGIALNGTNINNLKNAVMNGSDVKVIFHGGGNTHQSIKLTRVRVETTSDGTGVVSIIGFYDESVPTSTPVAGNYLYNGFYNNDQLVHPKLYSYSTTGQFVSYFSVTSTQIPGNTSYINLPMTWFVSR